MLSRSATDRRVVAGRVNEEVNCSSLKVGRTMTDWLARRRTEIARGYRLFEAIKPSWVRYALAGGLGAILAVLCGAVSPHDDVLKVYIGLAALIVTATSAFVGGRLINEHADRRATRRQRLAALLRIRLLVTALRDASEQLDNNFPRTPEPEKHDEATVARVSVIMSAMCFACEDPPAFDGVLNDEHDVLAANSSLTVFRQVRQQALPFVDRGLSAAALHAREPPVSNLLAASGRELMDSHISLLDKVAKYLELRLIIDGRAIPFPPEDDPAKPAC